MKLLYAVIIALIAFSSVLSADAVRCYVCNSHIDPDCLHMGRNGVHSPSTSEKFLKECDHPPQGSAFCRKTAITIEVTGEHRVVRRCGWMEDVLQERNISCFSADNEGFLQTICACYGDACNAASSRFGLPQQLLVVAMSGVGVLMALRSRRSG